MTVKSNLRHSVVIVTTVLLFLAIPCGLFSYFYVSGKREYLTSRNLRFLGIQSRQLSLRIENDFAVLSNLVTTAVTEYCGRLPRAVAEACLIDTPPGQLPKTGLTVQEGFSDSLEKAFGLAPNLKLVSDPSLVVDGLPIAITLHPQLQTGVFQVRYDYQGPARDKGVEFSATALMAELAGGLSSEDVFDDVLIVDQGQKDNPVIFQQSTSGPRFVRLGTVKDENGKEVPFTDVMLYPRVLQMDLAGAQYKLFVQPVRLPVKDDVTESGGANWILCGLVRADRFRSESLAMSYTVLLLFLFLFILTMVSWPLLKLRSLGPTDPLGFADVLFAAVSVLIISSLMTFFLMDLYAYGRLESRLDESLKQFADNIDHRFDTELERLVAMLDRVVQSETVQEKQVSTSILCPTENGCKRPPWWSDDDPYFGLIALIPAQGAESGKQSRKWTIDPVSTALIDVSNRAYFRNIKEERGWRLPSQKQFFIEPVFSWNTGETLALLSMEAPLLKTGASPTEHLDSVPEAGPDPQPVRHVAGAPEWVITATAKWVSLRNTVVPPGFGYAIIDERGTVMFHSNLRRTLVENFVEECDNDRDLRAMLFARADGWINAPYEGRGHRLYVKPLDGLPWMLVVFRDREIVRTENLELLSASLILSFFYGLVFLLPVLLLCFRKPAWMWPGAGYLADYRRLLAGNVGFIALLLAQFVLVHHNGVPWLAFFVPPFALVLNCLKLKRESRSSPWKHPFFTLALILPALLFILSWQDPEAAGAADRVRRLGVVLSLYGLFLYLFPPRRLSASRSAAKSAVVPESPPAAWLSLSVGYLMTAVSLVVIVSIVPTMVLFHSAHDTEMEILVKHGQFHLARSLNERDRRVQSEYRDIVMPSGYLEKRLGSADDIYQAVFWGTTLWSSKPASTDCISKSRLFEWAVEKIRPLYNNVAIETRELVRDATGDCSFQWESVLAPSRPAIHPGPAASVTESGPRVTAPIDATVVPKIRLVRAPGPAAYFLPIESHVPLLSWPESLWWWLGLVLTVPLFLAGLYLLVRFVAKRVFLLEEAFPPVASARVTDLGEVTQNTLVLGPACSGKTRLLDRSDFLRVDIRLIAAAGTWVEAFRQEIPSDKKVVAIDHLEYELHDPQCNSEKLRLLERFLDANCTLVVASSADPMSFSVGAFIGKETKDEDASQCADRWAAVWGGFARRIDAANEAQEVGEEKLRAVLSQSELTPEVAHALLRECKPTEQLRGIGSEIAQSHLQTLFNQKQVVVEVLDRSRAHYRALWATCSGEEKYALFDLARDGFANAKKPVLRQLVARGLIVPHPHLQLLNESFRQFVLEMEPAKEIPIPKEASPWAVVRGTLVAALIVVALVVFLTQPQLLNVSNTFIAAASAGIPALLKLFDLIRGNVPR